MNIIHINNCLTNGGKENMLVDIANEQYRNNHNISIIIINDGVEMSISNRLLKGVNKYYIYRKRNSNNILVIFKLLFILLKTKNDSIIHCHSLYLGKYLRFITNKKIVFTVHDIGYRINPLKYYNKLFAISNSVKNDIINRSNYNIEVVNNGIITSNIKTKNKKNKDSIEILNISRLVHDKKGQDLLIKALAGLLNHRNNIKLHFIGRGPSYNYLYDLSSYLGIIENVIFHGNKSRNWIYKNIKNYDILVQSSRYEGFGLTVAEAMAAKVPVIVANNDGPAEIIENGKYGFIFKNSSVDDLSNQLLKVIDFYESDNISSIVEDAYKHVINKYDIKTTAIRYIEEYRKIV